VKLQDSDFIKNSSLFRPRTTPAKMREWLWVRLGGVRTAMCASLLLLMFFIWFENSSLQILLFTLLTAWQHRSTLGVWSSTTIAMASAYGIFLLIDLMAESYLLFFLLSVLILFPPENSTLAEARGTPAVLMNYSKIEEMLVSSNSSGGSTEDDLGTQQDDDQAEGGQQEEQEEDETSTALSCPPPALREVWTSNQSSLAISTSSKTTSRKGSMDSSSSFSPGEQFTVTQSLQHSWQDHNLLRGAGVGVRHIQIHIKTHALGRLQFKVVDADAHLQGKAAQKQLTAIAHQLRFKVLHAGLPAIGFGRRT